MHSEGSIQVILPFCNLRFNVSPAIVVESPQNRLQWQRMQTTGEVFHLPCSLESLPCTEQPGPTTPSSLPCGTMAPDIWCYHCRTGTSLHRIHNYSRRVPRRGKYKPWASIHQAVRRLTVKLREVSKLQDGCYNNCIASKFDRLLGSTTAEVSVKFQNDYRSRGFGTSGDLVVRRPSL